MKTLGLALLVSIGVFAMIFGEFDDSPGLQGVGLILIVWAFFIHFRSSRFK